jgi:hypothetical protein
MDGRSGLNLLYTMTYDTMVLSRSAIRPPGAPFLTVIPGLQAIPLGQVDLPITFGAQANFHMEMLTFEIAEFRGAYQASHATLSSWLSPTTPI